MASFGIVKVCPNGGDRPDGTVHWEPKLAFHEVARRYGADEPPRPREPAES